MTDTISICFPKGKQAMMKRFALLATKRDRSVNYMVPKATETYPGRQEDATQ